jgi:hypothetical protein
MFGPESKSTIVPKVVPKARNIPTAVIAKLTVAAHPRILRYAGKLSLPMTARLLAKSIMKQITEAAAIPLMIAAHASALVGSTLDRRDPFIRIQALPSEATQNEIPLDYLYIFHLLDNYRESLKWKDPQTHPNAMTGFRAPRDMR